MILEDADRKKAGKDWVPGSYNSETKEYKDGSIVRVIFWVLQNGGEHREWKRLEECNVPVDELCFFFNGRVVTDCQEDRTFNLKLGPSKDLIIKIKGSEMVSGDRFSEGRKPTLSYMISPKTELGAILAHITQYDYVTPNIVHGPTFGWCSRK